MAALTTITVPVTYEMTDTGRDVLRGHVASILAEMLETELRAFIREEVKKALDSQGRALRMQTGKG